MAKKTGSFPWERLDGEGEKPYQAFVLYRDMGLERTYQAVADGLQKSYTLIRRWKDKFEWEQRALAYDNYLQKEALKDAKRQTKEMRERQAKVGMYLQKMALEGLKSLNPKGLGAKDLRLLLKDGIEIERQSRIEEATEMKNSALVPLNSEETEDVVVYVPDNGMLGG